MRHTLQVMHVLWRMLVHVRCNMRPGRSAMSVVRMCFDCRHSCSQWCAKTLSESDKRFVYVIEMTAYYAQHDTNVSPNRMLLISSSFSRDHPHSMHRFSGCFVYRKVAQSVSYEMLTLTVFRTVLTWRSHVPARQPLYRMSTPEIQSFIILSPASVTWCRQAYPLNVIQGLSADVKSTT